MKISYDWLKSYVPEIPDAEKLGDIITYHLAEVETIEKLENGDSVLDIKILPNRAHDLLSHQGMAREVSSLLNIKYNDPTPVYKVPTSSKTELQAEVQTDKCRRYVARIVRGVTVKPSPDWVVKHLESMGQRSINNIVDATNILMFDCGQPSHVYDLDKVKDSKIFIKTSPGGEKISLLGGVEKELEKDMIAIYDVDGHPICTGIKGGVLAELSDNTKNIILQIDNFDPVAVRKMSLKLGIRTEGGKRFENDLSPELSSYGMLELSALIAEMCPEATFEDIVDVYPVKQVERKLSFSAVRVSQILGLDVSVAQIEDILKRYNIAYTENAGSFEIVVPAMRLDLVMEEDMAEEIGRVMGYDKLDTKLPQVNFIPKQNETYAKISWARNKLLADGYSEVMTYSFADSGEVEVMQSASDKKFLRTNISDGLKQSIKLNQANAPLLGTENIKIFEIGTVFAKGAEEIHVCFGDKKNVTEVSLADFCKDMPSDFSLEPTNYNTETKFTMWPLYPFIARDVAVWVPSEVESSEVAEVIKENAGDMVMRGPELFDEFKKEGKTSYAFRIVFQSYERTLTDIEVNEIMDAVTAKLKEKNWQVR